MIGHAGADAAQPLVVLDDEYDCIEYTNRRPEDLDAEVLAYCRILWPHDDGRSA